MAISEVVEAALRSLTSLLDTLDTLNVNPIDANQSRADLTDTDLIDADLSGADLTDADLRGANLCDADLRGADLSEANLIGVNLSETYLCGACLSGANLSDAIIAEDYLTNANLMKPEIDGTILAYQKASEKLQQENQELREKLSLFETQFENRVAKEVDKRTTTNQGFKGKKKLTWQGLRFKSEPEVKIAQALDERGILFFPLPSGRVMTEEGMRTREVDFLICSQGLWGILECDGEIFHPSAAIDHKRDNDYKRHSVWFIQRFTDKECKKNPHEVVSQFLDMLHKFDEDQRYRISRNQTNESTQLSKENPEDSELPTFASYFEDSEVSEMKGF